MIVFLIFLLMFLFSLLLITGLGLYPRLFTAGIFCNVEYLVGSKQPFLAINAHFPASCGAVFNGGWCTIVYGECKGDLGWRYGSAAGWTWFTDDNSSMGPYVKCNSDANVCYGLVVRNADGFFVRAKSGNLESSISILEAEAYSIKEALSWLKDLGYTHVVFETDNSLLFDAFET